MFYSIYISDPDKLMFFPLSVCFFLGGGVYAAGQLPRGAETHTGQASTHTFTNIYIIY
jgi:hypothetical protein